MTLKELLPAGRDDGECFGASTGPQEAQLFQPFGAPVQHRAERDHHEEAQRRDQRDQRRDAVEELVRVGRHEVLLPEHLHAVGGDGVDVGRVAEEEERIKDVRVIAEANRLKESVRINAEAQAAEVLVKQGERVVMNSQDVKMLLGSGQDGALAMLSMLGGGMPKAGAEPEATQLRAREGLMQLAGRERKCFVLTLPLFGQHEIQMIFTEAGELARIDLPDGYALLEPTIHGLQEGQR